MMETPATEAPALRIRTESGAGRRHLISLTPLIDVVFILLVFFMLTASAPQWETILLGDPVRAGEGDTPPVAILIRMDRDGGLILDRNRVPRDKLAGLLRSALAASPGRPIVLQPERGIPMQQVVELLDSLSALPAGSISLMRSAEAAR
jgi:biopolymer transport protein ExbD